MCPRRRGIAVLGRTWAENWALPDKAGLCFAPGRLGLSSGVAVGAARGGEPRVYFLLDVEPPDGFNLDLARVAANCQARDGGTSAQGRHILFYAILMHRGGRSVRGLAPSFARPRDGQDRRIGLQRRPEPPRHRHGRRRPRRASGASRRWCCEDAKTAPRADVCGVEHHLSSHHEPGPSRHHLRRCLLRQRTGAQPPCWKPKKS